MDSYYLKYISVLFIYFKWNKIDELLIALVMYGYYGKSMPSPKNSFTVKHERVSTLYILLGLTV